MCHSKCRVQMGSLQQAGRDLSQVEEPVGDWERIWLNVWPVDSRCLASRFRQLEDHIAQNWERLWLAETCND